jgi:acid phosphatase family membrane protein YuiD
LKEILGHEPKEVVVGAVVGILVGVVFGKWW